MPMSKHLYKILTIKDNQPLSLERLDILKDYDGIEFKSGHANQLLSRIPSNIKYIDLSITSSYDKPLENLPYGLIGIAFSYLMTTTYIQYCIANIPLLPHGVKRIYIFQIDIADLINILPSSVEYVGIGPSIFRIEHGTNSIIYYMRNPLEIWSDMIYGF